MRRRIARQGGGRLRRLGALLFLVVAAFVYPATASGAPVISVINGNQAAQGTFPFMAFVVFENATVTEVCSGTLVSNNVVLTAGHCGENPETGVVHNAGYFTVITGSANWTAPPRVISKVSAVAIYPGFLRTSLQGDAAVLQISAPVASPPVRLATTPPLAGTGAIIAGWGNTVYEQEGITEILRYGSTAVQSSTFCQQEWGTKFHSATQLCALDYPTYTYGSCFGDSGGPMLQEVGAEYVEIGITSFGGEECETSLPNVDTRADVVEPWVGQEITALAPPAPAPAPAPTPATPKVVTSPPTLPILNAAAARQILSSTLLKRLGYRYKRRYGYQVNCTEGSASRQKCFMGWNAAAFRYNGTAAISYYLEGSTVETAVTYRIKRIPLRCRRRCHWTMFES
jgi:V8-like Glu-specific endopeptidase